MLESLFNRVAGLQGFNFIKKRLQPRRFPVKFEKFLRAPIMKNIWERLLLNGLALDLNFSLCLQQRDRTAPRSILRRNNFSDFTAICFRSEWSDENSQEFNLTRYLEIGWLRLKLQKKEVLLLEKFTPKKLFENL